MTKSPIHEEHLPEVNEILQWGAMVIEAMTTSNLSAPELFTLPVFAEMRHLLVDAETTQACPECQNLVAQRLGRPLASTA